MRERYGTMIYLEKITSVGSEHFLRSHAFINDGATEIGTSRANLCRQNVMRYGVAYLKIFSIAFAGIKQ